MTERLTQHIGIQLENEKGEIIESSSVNYADIGLIKDENASIKYPWLTTIDPHGDTTFNVLQIKYVMEELKILAEQDQGRQIFITEIIAFLNKINRDVHLYIKFVGD